MEKIDIPEDVQRICREFAKVAIANGLHGFEAKFRPPYTSEWNSDVNISWTAGRHFEDSNQLSISSQLFVNTKVNIPTK